MKLYFSKFIFFIFLALVSCSKPDAYDSQGNPISLKQYQGKWIIINYWASWCGPCLEEMPTLNKLYHEYPNQLIILGVSFDGLNAEKINESAGLLLTVLLKIVIVQRQKEKILLQISTVFVKKDYV